jgi:hypothetical protein
MSLFVGILLGMIAGTAPQAKQFPEASRNRERPTESLPCRVEIETSGR